MSPDEIRQRFPLHQCAACGSTWFREEWFVELPERFWRYDLEHSVTNPIGFLVCACGQAVSLLPSGVQGRTAKRFQNSLKQMEGHLKGEVIAAFREQAAAERAQLPALQRRVKELEGAVGRRLAKRQLAAGERKARGRHWEVPRRHSANQPGNNGRDWLVLELQRRGITFRKARAAVTAVVDAMREGLRRDAWVETPIGKFELRSRAQPLQRKRFGREQCLYERPTVVFTPVRRLLDDNSKHQK
jgi:nucleoid DNA-binding protein